jgi:hypothetical protein
MSKTTHQLAKELLALPDVMVVHHYYMHEDFDDDGYHCYSEPVVELCDGILYMMEGEFVRYLDTAKFETIRAGVEDE